MTTSPNSILLADDLSNTSRAGRLRSEQLRDVAVDLCRRLNMPLRIIYASSAKGLFPKVFADKLRALDQVEIQDLQKEMSLCSVKSKVIFVHEDPALAILKEEKKQGVEMLILGCHGKTGLHKALLGSVSEEVIRNSESPVLILGPGAQKSKFTLPLGGNLRILVLTDLSFASIPAEDYALSLACKLNAKLTVCYSLGHQIYQLKQTVAARRYVSPAVDKMFKDIREGSVKLFDKKISRLGKTADVDGLFLKEEKKIESVLPKMINKRFDLVVMGTHGRNKILTGFIGSSARDVILKSPAPVIVVRSNAGLNSF